jgi:hypothetical protein
MFKFWDMISDNKKNLIEETKRILKAFEFDNELEPKMMAYIVGIGLADYDRFFEGECEPYVTAQLIAAALALNGFYKSHYETANEEEIKDIVAFAERTYMPNEEDKICTSLVNDDAPITAIMDAPSPLDYTGIIDDDETYGPVCDGDDDEDEVIEINEDTLETLVNFIGKILKKAEGDETKEG